MWILHRRGGAGGGPVYGCRVGERFAEHQRRKASCSGQIKPNASNKKAKVTIKLQKKTGSSWTTMQTWSKTATGLAGAKASGTRAVTAGLTYRVYLTGYVYDSNGNVLESITKASASKVA